VFVQVAEPSRGCLPAYRATRARLLDTAARVNARFGSDGYRPIRLLEEHHEPAEVYQLYRAADVCVVNSLHDGMNLVAKEFIASRDDNDGVLVLSQFTGAAHELTEALIVNPYDLDQASDALAAALRMAPEERRARMHYMRAHLAEFNVYRWAGRMLIDAARLRKRESLWQKIEDSQGNQS
jgi:trehalose 6-phosphate synthase